MNRLPFRLSLLALLAVGLFGCRSMAPLNSGFTANVAGFHPTDPAKPEEGGTISLRFINETVASLGFSHSEHKLYLNGTLVANIANDAPFGIVSVNEITRDLPLHFDNPAFVRQLVSNGSSVVNYRLESRLYQRLGNDRNNMHLTAEGTLDLRGTPAK
jgi:hypothetical protein